MEARRRTRLGGVCGQGRSVPGERPSFVNGPSTNQIRLLTQNHVTFCTLWWFEGAGSPNTLQVDSGLSPNLPCCLEPTELNSDLAASTHANRLLTQHYIQVASLYFLVVAGCKELPALVRFRRFQWPSVAVRAPAQPLPALARPRARPLLQA